MTLRLTVDLDGLPWGDLFDFVDAARSADVPADQRVEMIYAPQDDEMLLSLGVDLPKLGGRALTLSPGEREDLATALTAVIDGDGDARSVLEELRQIRDRLMRN